MLIIKSRLKKLLQSETLKRLIAAFRRILMCLPLQGDDDVDFVVVCNPNAVVIGCSVCNNRVET